MIPAKLLALLVDKVIPLGKEGWEVFHPNSSQKIFKKMGFYSDQSGIMHRYQRERHYWNEHLQKTKAFIIKNAADKNKGRCAVLGSGWLLDVPAKELSEMFSEVWLFDISHHALVKKSIKDLTNIHYSETDLSGFAKKVYHLSHEFKKIEEESFIDNIEPGFEFDLSRFDFIISCNILNQLDILILDYLKKRTHLTDEVEQYLRRSIQNTHLNILPKRKSCLITDVAELWLNKKDETEKETSLIFSDNFPQTAEEKWIWKFDNSFMYRNTHKTWFRVVAINI